MYYMVFATNFYLKTIYGHYLRSFCLRPCIVQCNLVKLFLIFEHANSACAIAYVECRMKLYGMSVKEGLVILDCILIQNYVTNTIQACL